jgi:gliding motility-associated-like protein
MNFFFNERKEVRPLPIQEKSVTDTLKTITAVIKNDLRANLSGLGFDSDTCLPAFYNSYRASNFCDLITNMVESKDHNLISVGIMRDVGTDAGSQRGTFLKFDKNGKILISKKNSLKTNNALDLIKLKDSLLLIPSTQNGMILLNKTDDQFNTIWTKSYKIENRQFNYRGLIQAKDSSLYMLIDYDAPYPPYLGLLKFSKEGDFIWQKNYIANETFVGFQNNNLLELNGFIYLKATTSIDNQYPTQVIFKVNMENGNVVWTNYYRNPDFELYTQIKFIAFNNQILLSGQVSSGPPLYNVFPVLIFIREDGSVAESVIYKSKDYTLSYFTTVTIASNGDLIAEFSADDYSTDEFQYNDVLLRLDAKLNVVRANIFHKISNNGTQTLLEDSEGNIFTSGDNYYSDPYSADIFIRKFSPDLKSGNCPSLPFSFRDSTIEIISKPVSFKYSPDISIIKTNETLLLEDHGLKLNEVFCNSVNNCEALKITGPALICNKNGLFIYNTKRNNGCTSPVAFQIDTAFGKIISTTDSTVSIAYKANGNTKLYAMLSANCKIITDSLLITIQLSNNSIELGPDLEICGSTLITLNAGEGFKSYAWQDGSKSSTLSISKPGQYFVTAKDFCDNIYSDTVLVTTKTPDELSAGPDTFKCNSDSVTITATTGFTKYSWSAGTSTLPFTNSKITVSPDSTTMYYVTAEKNPGCTSIDSIKISVFKTPAINLGKDTIICKGDSIILATGPGFTKWEWSNGFATSEISIKEKGIYSVKAYDNSGCFSTDTFNLLKVNALPVVSLNKKSYLCAGTSKVLDAGKGFSNYLWNNGDVTSSIEIKSIGKYWVTVTDANTCKTSDTAEIKTIFPLPTGFTPKDTAICSYETIELKSSRSFIKYLWSTGEFKSSITIKSPGNYSLQVTDENGCEAKESIKVLSKECAEIVLFPNAFTPNNDYLNDIFKPTVYGGVTNYELRIYNRFGTIIFKSTNPEKGWDGLIKGELQPIGTYVWICKYELNNKPSQTQKGIISLIR